MSDSMYLCYDLKGIQSFIFAVPRLRYICGGSALVDIFDRETVQKNIKVDGCTLLFAGGGKGAFNCADATAVQTLKQNLIDAAHDVGLGISFGIHADYNEAAHLSGESYPYFPAELDGHPCPESGLYPTDRKVHPVIAKRKEARWHYEEELLKSIVLPDGKTAKECAFFSNVNVNDEDDWQDGEAGAITLGNRNRWAVICMDGNNMGDQHREAANTITDPELYQDWLRTMSTNVDDTTRAACRQGISVVIDAWFSDVKRGEAKTGKTQDEKLILPVRPLLVGGDDVVMLCHVDYAFAFVKAVCGAFSEMSQKRAQDIKASKGYALWPASDGKGLTISAGVLFAPVTLPLSTAIDLAESLLATAKKGGRAVGSTPAPACLDWESVTEGVVDNIAGRRQRELVFKDGDLGDCKVSLTKRPYTLSAFDDVQTLAHRYAGKAGQKAIPGTIRHEVLVAMRAADDDRRAYIERLRKHQEALAEDLDHGSNVQSPGGKWEMQGDFMVTPVIDAMLLLEESSRMDVETAGGMA